VSGEPPGDAWNAGDALAGRHRAFLAEKAGRLSHACDRSRVEPGDVAARGERRLIGQLRCETSAKAGASVILQGCCTRSRAAACAEGIALAAPLDGLDKSI
jgi:hypothetical protein